MNLRHLEKIVYVLFFVSGACGLVYEVIWGKYLSLFIGNTTHATMIVLATFMGGLALGSFLFGRIADRVTRPLKLYAWLEIGIGLYGVLYSPILESTKELYFSLAEDMAFGGFAHMMVKLPLAFFTLIIPTSLMGGTLPVLSRFFIRSLGTVGRRVALLYFINSFGAVAGTLIAGFYLVEQYGLILGLTSTGIVNVVVGIVILVIEMVLMKQPAAPSEADEEAPVVYEKRLVKLAMVGIFLSGFTSMIYELVWFRVFAVVLESSTYSFSLMLAAFITGITVGSLVAGRVMRGSRRLLFLFGVCELAIAVTVILAVPFYERLPYYFWSIRYLLRPIPETYLYYNLAKFGLCFGIMLIPTLFFGMTLPLVSNIASTAFQTLARKIGNVYAINTVGTLLGALSAGLLFIPVLGLAHSLTIAVAINLFVAVIVIWRTSDAPARVWRVVPPVCAGILVILYVFVLPGWNNARFALGLFRVRGAPPATYAAFAASPQNNYEIKYYLDDLSSNVAVIEQPISDTETRISLTVNGKVDASSSGDVPTQILLGQLPLMLKSEVDDVLIIGFGSGMTAGTALAHPVTSLDCVEISAGVAEAGRLFAPYNNNVLENPRFNLIVEDAKTYIKTTRKQYDVVVSEPSNPWMAGVGNLFSIEFFKDVESVLKPEGLVVQWFHRYEVSDEVVSTAVRTFQRVFPFTYIFQGNSFDMIMVGSKRRITPDFARIEEKFRIPEVQQELTSIHIHDTAALLALQMISPEYIAKITSLGTINSDYRPVIEYQAPLAFYLGETSAIVDGYDERFTSGNRLMLTRYLAEHPLTPEQYKQLFRFFRIHPTDNEAMAYSIAAKYITLRPDDKEMQREFAGLTLKKKNHGYTLKVYKPTPDATDTLSLDAYTEHLYSARKPDHSIFNPQQFPEVRTYLERCADLVSQKDKYLIKLGRLALVTGRYNDALQYFKQVADMWESDTGAPHTIALDEALALIGRALFEMGDYENARKFTDAAFDMNTGNLTAAYHQLMIEQVERFQAIEAQP